MNPINVFLYESKSDCVNCLDDFPLIIISPSSNLSNPPNIFKSVDLPLPDLPSINTSPFSSNLRLIPFRA